MTEKLTLEDLLAEGCTLQEIINELGVSYNDAKATISRLMEQRDIHIVDWEYASEGYVWHPVYTIGKSFNKAMPKEHKPRRDWAVQMLFGNDVVDSNKDSVVESGFGF
jgi:thiamine kinase-like enzyme